MPAVGARRQNGMQIAAVEGMAAVCLFLAEVFEQTSLFHRQTAE